MTSAEGVQAPTHSFKLTDYPAAIREVKSRLQQTREELKTAHLRTKTAETDLYERIREGTTSDKAAEKILPQRKLEDLDYQEVYVAEAALQRQQSELEGELEQLRGEFAIALLHYQEQMATPIIRPLQFSVELVTNKATEAPEEPLLPFGGK